MTLSARGGETEAGSGWPETMKRELEACRNPMDRRAWSEKWALYLSGEANRDDRPPQTGHPEPP